MTDPSGDPHSRRLPEISECHVERLPDGRIQLRHKGTGDVEIVDAVDGVERAGMQLRILASYARAGILPKMRPVPVPLPWADTSPEFRVGYLP